MTKGRKKPAMKAEDNTLAASVFAYPDGMWFSRDDVFNPLQITAKMHFPLEEEKSSAYFDALMRKKIIESVLAKNEWPVSLGRQAFLQLIPKGDAPPNAKALGQRRAQGWMVGCTFEFLLRANMWHRGTPLGAEKCALGTLNKALFRLGKIAVGNVPGTNVAKQFSKPALTKARRSLWPVAHYWAAEFTETKNLRCRSKRDLEYWVDFMNLAETYRQLGIRFGVFEALSSGSYFNENIIFNDKRFSGMERIDLPPFDEDEIGRLRGYESEEATYKKNRPDRVEDANGD